MASPSTAPATAASTIGSIGMPARVAVPATAIKMGVPGTTMPITGTASTTAPPNATRSATTG